MTEVPSIPAAEPPPTTIAAALEAAGGLRPNDEAFIFVDSAAGARTLTNGALLAVARDAAARLAEAGARPGDRVLLPAEPGFDFVASVFACLLSGTVAVPTYPPNPARLERTLPRIAAIVGDCDAEFVLTNELGSALEPLLQAPSGAPLRWVVLDGSAKVDLKDPSPSPAPESPAVIQYTSGSTSTPKGVVLTHANLVAQIDALDVVSSFGHQTEVCWLPPYHDMGLVSGLLLPIWTAGRSVLMSPVDFLRQPVRWLEAVSTYGAVISGGPNFAYDLCVRRVSEEQRVGLDLRSWTHAFNGAEPIRASTIAAFNEAFEPCGFDPSAWFPCYGLAEATLMASGTGRRPPVVLRLDASDLEAGRAVVTDGGTRPVVSSGAALPGHDIRIVDVDRGVELPIGEVGEIWFAGASVAAGFWNNADESLAMFGAHLADGRGPYLRTEDLGFVDDQGELYVVGRSKDVVIIRGRNLYPSDIEVTVEGAHADIRAGCVAAVAVEDGEAVQLAIVAEVADDAEVDAVVHQIRRAVLDEHGVDPDGVVLLPTRAIPKTSSGKIQRGACRTIFIEGGGSEHGRWSRRVRV